MTTSQTLSTAATRMLVQDVDCYSARHGLARDAAVCELLKASLRRFHAAEAIKQRRRSRLPSPTRAA